MAIQKQAAQLVSLKAPKKKKAAAALEKAAAPAAGKQPLDFITTIRQPVGSELCWATCAIMVAEFLGVSSLPTVEQLGDEAPGHPGFSTPQSALQIQTTYASGAISGAVIGCQIMRKPVEQNDLRDALLFPVPVQMGVQWNAGGGHVLLIVGTTLSDGVRYFFVNNPDRIMGDQTVPYQGLLDGFGLGRWAESIVAFELQS